MSELKEGYEANLEELYATGHAYPETVERIIRYVESLEAALAQPLPQVAKAKPVAIAKEPAPIKVAPVKKAVVKKAIKKVVKKIRGR